MITATNVSIQFGKRILFDEVNIKFHGERCYGMIGANGAGKSTFLKVLSGEIEPNTGQVSLEAGKRMAVLSQDHYKYDDVSVLNTVIMGYEKLWELIKEKEAIYAKPDFSEEDGLIAADLEIKFEVVHDNSVMGGGTLPNKSIASPVIQINELENKDLMSKLMRNDIPIIPRVNKNNIIIDLRSTSEKNDIYIKDFFTKL